MKIVLCFAFGLLALSVGKVRSDHSFLEERLSRDDYVFRVPRTHKINMVREGDKILLQGIFILHIHATTSAVVFSDREAIEVSVYRDGIFRGVAKVKYQAPTVAEKNGGDIIFQKDKITRLKVLASDESKCFLPGIYRMHIDVINSRYDNYRKTFIVPKGGQNFWTDSLEIK